MTRIWRSSTGRSPVATTRRSRGSMSSVAGPRASAGHRPLVTRHWSLVTLALLALLPSCRATQPELLIIPADRTITRLADGGYRVTEAWLLERFELERGLRLQLERCEGKQDTRHTTIRPARAVAPRDTASGARWGDPWDGSVNVGRREMPLPAIELRAER